MEKITVFEKCKHIRNLILKKTAEIIVYENWSDKFKLKQILEIPVIVKKWEDENGSFKIDPNELNSNELKELGFGIWEDKNDMRLIPIWLFPFLAKKIETIDINGNKYFNLSDIDNDHRFGRLANGVIPKDKKKRTQNETIKKAGISKID